MEVSGSPLLNSWLGRDLGLSGRARVRTAGGTEERLVRIDTPIAHLPQLAVHLDPEVTEKVLLLDRQFHLAPVTGPDRAANVRAARPVVVLREKRRRPARHRSSRSRRIP